MADTAPPPPPAEQSKPKTPKRGDQTGTVENLTAVQVPVSLILKLGSLVKLSADAGVFTGDDISLRARNGGRIYLGAALDVKLGRSWRTRARGSRAFLKYAK